MLVSLLALSILSEYSGFFPRWRALVPTGADWSPSASSLAGLNNASNSLISICSCLCPQQMIPPKLYYFVSFMLPDSPKFLWCIQENRVPHFPLTCRRQRIKQLVLTKFLYSYCGDKLTLLAPVQPPSHLSEFEGGESPFLLKHGEYTQGCHLWLSAMINLWQMLLWKPRCCRLHGAT